MKFWRVSSFGLLAFSLLFAASDASAQQAYPMLCKAPLDIEASSASMLSVLLKKSSVAAGGSGAVLARGTCAWVDRPIGSGEPSVLVVLARGAWASDGKTNILLVEEARFTRDWNFLISGALSPGAVLTFHVYNDGRGTFRIPGGSNTSFGSLFKITWP